MIVASTRPILALGAKLILGQAARLPMSLGSATLLAVLVAGPLLGSLITEPAAMTMTALLLYAVFYTAPISQTLRYAMLGTLFVNISIGGVLTHFAAPPVIMCAPAWGWGLWHMLANFGWKAVLAVVVNAAALTWLFRGQLGQVTVRLPENLREDIPHAVTAVHLAALALLVVLLHHPVAFLAVLVVFFGFTAAYPEYQSELLVKESLLVAVFLAGVVILGKPQQWWVQSLLTSMESTTLFLGATALTAITDNAALTYLGALVPDLPDAGKYALLAGAVSGGGLTVIANAPNPAGYAILKGGFPGQVISPLKLLLAALAPTAVAVGGISVSSGMIHAMISGNRQAQARLFRSPLMNRAALALFLLFALCPQALAQDQPNPVDLRWELFAAPGGQKLAVLWLTPGPGFKTYSHQPGPSGMPTTVELRLGPTGQSVQALYPQGQVRPLICTKKTARLRSTTDPRRCSLCCLPSFLPGFSLEAKVSLLACTEVSCWPMQVETQMSARQFPDPPPGRSPGLVGAVRRAGHARTGCGLCACPAGRARGLELQPPLPGRKFRGGQPAAGHPLGLAGRAHPQPHALRAAGGHPEAVRAVWACWLHATAGSGTPCCGRTTASFRWASLTYFALLAAILGFAGLAWGTVFPAPRPDSRGCGPAAGPGPVALRSDAPAGGGT